MRCLLTKRQVLHVAYVVPTIEKFWRVSMNQQEMSCKGGGKGFWEQGARGEGAGSKGEGAGSKGGGSREQGGREQNLESDNVFKNIPHHVETYVTPPPPWIIGSDEIPSFIYVCLSTTSYYDVI